MSHVEILRRAAKLGEIDHQFIASLMVDAIKEAAEEGITPLRVELYGDGTCRPDTGTYKSAWCEKHTTRWR